jgi:hypothetical protein
MRRRITISVLAAAIVTTVALAMAWPDKKMTWRDIDCANVTPGRAKTICQTMSESMEWTWMGHAITSPGWRVTGARYAKSIVARGSRLRICRRLNI